MKFNRLKSHKQWFTKVFLKLFLIVSLIIVTGCATTSGNFGKLRSDDTVKQTFEDFTVLPGYNYFYYGTETFPRAFVGISKDLTLGSSDWTAIDMTSKILHNWIWAQANRIQGDPTNYGSIISGPDGNQAGVWYSLRGWKQWARIEFVNENTIKIGAPIDRQRNNRYNRSGSYRF
jgi:hypothetical protein